MSIQLANQVKHLAQQVEYLVSEVERLQDRVLALEAQKERKVAYLELDVPGISDIKAHGTPPPRKTPERS